MRVSIGQIKKKTLRDFEELRRILDSSVALDVLKMSTLFKR